MNRKNSTRNALITSVISLLLCVSMLVGATFAWFTDTVSSGLNTITAGNLDIELEYTKDPSDADSWKTVKDQTDLFSNALWEPGHTEVVYLRLANKGTLALNYQIGINVSSETEGTNVAGATFKLSDHIQFGVVEGQETKFADRAAAVAAVSSSSKKLNEGYTKASSMDAGAADAYMALVVYMPETVGNEANYRGTAVPTISLGVNVLASQKTKESDSFGPNYDLMAQGGSTSGNAPAENSYETYEIYPGAETSGTKFATMSIHADSVEDSTKPIEINIIPTGEKDNGVTITDEQESASFEITVSNIKKDNDKEIEVQLNVGMGLTGVKVYHDGDQIDNASYNTNTGYVIFKTKSFSPYMVVFDAFKAETPADPNEQLPTATVTAVDEHVGKTLTWNNVGGYYPTNPNDQTLEAAFLFKAPHDSTTVQNSKYKDWLCDFYVSMDCYVPDGALFLGGQYGTWGWVGFENNGFPVEANQEVPLLGTALGNGEQITNWTYEMIVGLVQEFTCGVARTYGTDMTTLEGHTFTVKLRLINPEDHSEYYDVNTTTYTFEADTSIKTAEALAAAVVAGGDVKLGANIDLGTTTITVPTGVTTNLDLNGFVVSGVCNNKDGSVFTINNGATLNIKDSRGNGKISYAAGSHNQGFAIKQVGNLNLYSGTIELTGDWTDGICYAVDIAPNVWSGTAADSVFNMHGGKVISSKDAIRVSNYSATGYAQMKVGFNMYGGEVIATRDGIFMQQHSEKQFDLFVNVTDGSITANVRPIRVYGPNATGTLSGNAKSMTITAESNALVLNGAVNTDMTWHTEGKIAVGGGMTVDNLNQYANITLY